MRYVDRARSAAAAPFVTVDFPSAYFRRMIINLYAIAFGLLFVH